MIEQRVQELKDFIAGNDGRNVADRRFARAVDELIDSIFDDISRVRAIPSRTLFDLFVIKVLYVGRRSRHADVIEYLGALLDRYLAVHNLFPVGRDGKMHRLYFSDILDDDKREQFFRSRYEAYRSYADSALFLSGVFPSGLARRRPGNRTPLRRRRASLVDVGYYVSTGKTMYRMAAGEAMAEAMHERATLSKLSEHFEVYRDALSEMSARYIIGFDRSVMTDKMLDSLNRYRASREERDLESARRYAELLEIDTAELERF